MTYIYGDNWLICDICGFKIRASQSRSTWEGRIVCEADWEPRHPQDFVRAKKDKIVADVIRAEPTDTFLTDNSIPPSDPYPPVVAPAPEPDPLETGAVAGTAITGQAITGTS